MDKSSFFVALRELAKEKGLSVECLIEKIKAAMLIAVKREHSNLQNAFIEINESSEQFDVGIEKMIVDEVADPENEISLKEATRISKNAAINQPMQIQLDPKKVGRIAAQAAKQVIKQGVREIEHNKEYLELKKHEGQIVTAHVSKLEDNLAQFTTIGIDGVDVVLPKNEQLAGYQLNEGDLIKVYISEVRNTEKGPKVMVSRTNSEFIKKLFELEIPEVADSTITIMAIAREPGLRTKVAVQSTHPKVDPVGTCIGQKGARINRIVKELGDEKVDVIRYEEDPAVFIQLALLPAVVERVFVTSEADKECVAIVPSNQVSLAIGNKGQNVRLVAKLTGYKIDIRAEELPAVSDDEVQNESEV
ncbi:MAG: transcription termination factor NusA [Oscillospiraceae bacterium]|jgi:N utilization substance protein A|nr:transcription termination factor NusA [Oscillospiraceae bacterium]